MIMTDTYWHKSMLLTYYPKGKIPYCFYNNLVKFQKPSPPKSLILNTFFMNNVIDNWRESSQAITKKCG